MNVLIIGANGQVGSELVKQFSSTTHQVIAITRRELDCTDTAAINSVLSPLQADVVINAAAYTAVDKAEDEPDLAKAVNAKFVEQLALFCTHRNIPLIHLSTDYVFDGKKLGPYNEEDLPNPQGVYAQSKLQGEEAILKHLKKHLIVRVSWVFGVHGANFVKIILKVARSKTELKIVDDQWGRPTAAHDIARVIVELVRQINEPDFNNWGIYHYASEGVTNWHNFASYFLTAAKEKGLNLALSNLVNIKTEEYPTKAVRPANSVLNTDKIEKTLHIQCQSWKEYIPELIDQFIHEEECYELSN